MALKSKIQPRSLILLTCVAACLALSTSGCLKTRAQLKEESEDKETSKGVPAQPLQEVQPQGQYVVDELKDEMTRMEGRIEDLERAQKDLSAKPPRPIKMT